MIAAIPARELAARHPGRYGAPTFSTTARSPNTSAALRRRRSTGSLKIWREAAKDVSGGAIDSGHYLAKARPQAVIDAFERHFV
jgi:hypothetical protein